MYAYIRGVLDSKKIDSVIVEAGGVGYQIFTAPSILSRLPAANSEVRLYTRLIVREDSHTLYGFISKDEQGMFDTLLTVSGVGPKAALSLVSAISPSQFGLAVLTEDYKQLTRAQGVGAKLAQKIIFELRDKMQKGLGGAADGKGAAAGLASLRYDCLGGRDGEPKRFRRAVARAVILCAALAASDEFHQLFVPGRAALISDVILDTAGAALGALGSMGLAGLWARKSRRGNPQ